MASAHISKMRTHESRSERALCSQVLRIRLSRWITIQNTPFMRFKSLIWKSFAFTMGKAGFQIRKGSESRSKTAFGTWFVPFVNRPRAFYYNCIKALLPNWFIEKENITEHGVQIPVICTSSPNDCLHTCTFTLFELPWPFEPGDAHI